MNPLCTVIHLLTHPPGGQADPVAPILVLRALLQGEFVRRGIPLEHEHRAVSVTMPVGEVEGATSTGNRDMRQRRSTLLNEASVRFLPAALTMSVKRATCWQATSGRSRSRAWTLWPSPDC